MFQITKNAMKRVLTTHAASQPNGNPSKKIKLRKYRAKKAEPTSPAGVLQIEIDELLKERNIGNDLVINDMTSVLNDPELRTKYHRVETHVAVRKLTANGDGLALLPDPVSKDGHSERFQVAVIPFALPGDVVKVRVFKTHPRYVECDLLAIEKPSSERNNDLIRDKYFGLSAGSQYECVPYETQLVWKRNVISSAYERFAPNLLQTRKIPQIQPTASSPLQFAYRTKITPHFDIPRSLQIKSGNTMEKPPALGFTQRGRPEWRSEPSQGAILDIESCALATNILNIALKNERARFSTNFNNYKRGATLLLRENTLLQDPEKTIEEQLHEAEESAKCQDNDTGVFSRDTSGNISYLEVKDSNTGRNLIKTCITNPRATATEYINGLQYKFAAGEFFQVNTSILPQVAEYVCKEAVGRSADNAVTHLVDAYCGAGFFAISSAHAMQRVLGVEISAANARSAMENALLNGKAIADKCTFVAGSAEHIFAEATKQEFPPDRTAVVIDPPRNGCDLGFLGQLSSFKPARIVYVSCNVHSQARDVQQFLIETANGPEYHVESIRGFDFFPQTHHVESICVLARS